MRKILVTLIFIFLLFISNVYCETVNTFFVVPFYTPDTNIGLACSDIVHFRKQESKFFSSLNMVALYTAKHQFMVGIIPKIYFNEDNYLLEAKINFSNFLKKFYGIGNNSYEDDKEEYVNRSHGFGVSLSRKIVKNIMFGVQYDLADMTMQDTDDDGQLQYIQTSGVISGVGIKAKLDTRDSNIYPTKGCLFNVDYLLYNNRLGSKYNYSKTTIDFRNYFYLLTNKLLFSYQLYGEFINGNSPIQHLSSIGGQNLLRGFIAGRYIDNIVLAIQPELKIKITNSIQLALFTGIGNVYEDLEEIDLKKIKIASGTGIRIKIKNNPRINFRIDFAASNESKGTYFTIMEAF